MFKNKNYYPFYFVLLFLLGILLGQKLSKSPDNTSYETNKINHILQYIESDYVDSVPLSEMEDVLAEAMMEKLDPHSIYITKEEFSAVNDPLAGKFDGIGVQFRMIHDTVVVIQALENGPSKKAGIRAGDRIVIANADTLAGKHFNSLDIQKHLKGERGSVVDLLVKRAGEKELLKFAIKRDAIPTFSIDAAFMLNKETAYIKLSQFSATTIDEFAEAMKQLSDEGMKKLVLDLRGNTGGYLGAAIFLADDFLEKGRLIVYTEGRNRPKKIYKSSSNTAFGDGELIILQDEISASASEILAGAIQDNDRGLIVGRRSFGKGLVQEQMNYRDGSAVRLTVARYFTPSGRSIQRSYAKGTEDYYNDYYNRLHSKAMFAPDSTQLNDSLKFKTLKGRTVYGGGGIWPDYFIPADTSINFYFYNQLISQSVIYEYAFEYVQKNREELLKKYSDVDAFIRGFKNDDKLYNQFLAQAEVKALKPGKQDISDSKSYILTLLKAEIARNLWEKGFYPVYLQNDRFVEKAMKIMDEKLP